MNPRKKFRKYFWISMLALFIGYYFVYEFAFYLMPVGYVLTIAIIVLFTLYFNRYANIERTIYDILLQQWGFAKQDDNNALHTYTLGKSIGYALKVKRLYTAMQAGLSPSRLVLFQLSKGSKHKIRRSFFGCEFITEKNHQAVQLFDSTNPFKPLMQTDRQLESTDFNRLFNAYSNNLSAPYYFFDPDTMHDLVEYKRRTQLSLNMESNGNRILIYVDASILVQQLTETLTVREVLTGKIAEDRMLSYQHSIAMAVREMQAIFALLDYKLAV